MDQLNHKYIVYDGVELDYAKIQLPNIEWVYLYNSYMYNQVNDYRLFVIFK